ncbi:NRDE family protein [Myxococcaceae bacterium GXIMD 01537]
MCTIVILRRVHPDWPLVLAANRDEYYARPAVGPQLLSESPRIIGGRDLERGGTWMGTSDGGFFVGLTNQRLSGPPVVAPRSRGEVVLRALQAGGLEATERYLSTLRPAEYNPFNLLYGDAHRLRVAYARSDADRLIIEDVPEGIHVLPNDVLDAPDLPKVRRARELAGEAARQPWPECVRGLEGLLADTALPPLEQVPEPPPGAPFTREMVRQYQALCIRTPGYGTRSSAIVALGPGRVGHYLSSDTPPCEGPFRDVAPLLYP